MSYLVIYVTKLPRNAMERSTQSSTYLVGWLCACYSDIVDHIPSASCWVRPFLPTKLVLVTWFTGQSIDQIVCLIWWAIGIQSDTSFCCSTTLPTPISSLQSIPPCHCWTWWKTLRLCCFVAAHYGGNILGWMAFVPVVTSSWKRWYLMMSMLVTLLSFQYDGHDLLVSSNALVFRRLHTYGHFSLFTECLIRFYKFQSSCFCDHK